MTPIADMIREMTAAGVPLDTILIAVEAVEKAIRPQKSADVSADNRREKDRIRKQIERENLRKSAESADNPQMSNSASISKIKKESKRGTRIASDWTPSDDERAFAKGEGFTDLEIQREGQKFRDWWTACAGSKGIKLDWSATWRQWIRNSADRAGKRPASPAGSSPADAAINWENVVRNYKKSGIWSRWAGPDPNSPACQCPREILIKYGILPDSPREAAE